ncbi:hypothetical protein [Pseudomonas vanderleydeniana]|uniref:Uncharacterized protein n=1 Tax=Pseudomonas vanderleydeniana TaxID=2745495 RepID=A0A9E6PSC6_9PSED|nr:hypothetical protein [Pseudomonas vanderleydeniana]QXI31126.1 hypothetical protein HU752_014815 [Pseudomonas vanderleydeniana]
MTISIFEISIRKELDMKRVSALFSSYFGIPVGGVVEIDEFWGAEPSEQQYLVGVRLNVSEVGYKTLVVCYCYFELYGESLGSLAKYLAVELGTDVAIGDYVHVSDVVNGRFMVFSADGEVAYGFESCESSGFDVVFSEKSKRK